MSATKHDGNVRDSYFEMVKRFPLVSIRDDHHLAEAQKVIDELFAREPLDEGEEEYLDALGSLVGVYEAQRLCFSPADDAAVLGQLMKARRISQKRLYEATGIAKSTICDVLNGHRRLTRSQIDLIAAYFGIDPGAFHRPTGQHVE
jgi:HTH-type transcriptional regulator / antitoxin HigA